MSHSPIKCSVYLDGQLLADGCTDTGPDLAPTVLSGLRVDWGRPTTIDQPSPSSATFKVLDPLLGERLVPLLAIGRRVDVRADAIIYPTPSQSTIPNIINGGMKNGSVTIAGDMQSATLLTSSTGNAAMTMDLPPLALSSVPTAWDAVPRTAPGQEWTYQLTVALPAAFLGWTGWAATVQPLAYSNPNGPAQTAGDATAVPAGGGAVNVTFTPPDGIWLGLRVRLYPPSPQWQQLDGTAWSAIVPDPGPSWDDLGTVRISALKMLAPAGGAAAACLVFSGRVTDVEALWDLEDAVQLTVIAQDWTAELANRFVGDTPWNKEALGTRAQRIVTLSEQPISLRVDTKPAALQVTWRDVDSQPATTLLQDLARSAGGVLWCATHLVTGPLLWLEDVNMRPAALPLVWGQDGLIRVESSHSAIANSLPLSACDVDAEPVRFTLDNTDTASQVAVGWTEQGTPPNMVAKVETLTDAGLAASIGINRMSVTTQLALQPDAAALASVLMARSSAMGWRLSGVQWDLANDDSLLDPDRVQEAFKLLDGTTRIGLPMALTDLPPWTDVLTQGTGSVPVYLEGGSYEFNAGAWDLALYLSAARGSAQGTLPWNALPGGDVVANPGALDNGSWRSRTTAANGTAVITWITGASGPPNPAGGSWSSWARKKWSVAATAAMAANGFEVYNGSGAADWIPLTPGASTTVTMLVRVIGVYPRRMRLSMVSATGVSLGEVFLNLTTNAWQTMTLTFVVPAGATGGRVICEAATVAQGGTPWAVNDQLDMTGLTVTPVAWTWQQFAPDVSWLDLYGVTYPDV